MEQRNNRLMAAVLLLLLISSLLAGCGGDRGVEAAAPAPPLYPGASWQMVAAPEEAGWSPSGLADAQAYAEAIGSAAVMVIDDGAVVAAWGDVERRWRMHSIRKSLFNALIGIHKGEMGLQQTLAEVEIEDREGLTPAEKEATVYDLLTARSGVYHPAAYETSLWQAQRPARGSHAPGSFWYYNNWDFNALLTIYEQETNTRVFDEFQRRVAGPLGMQDYRPRDGSYYWEPAVSEHPAYPFRLSARDLARFGWLYLNAGQWAGEQVVPAAWVAASTQAHAETGRDADWGYLWWVLSEENNGYDGFMARGGDTQMLVVLPQEKVVFVHLADTYSGRTVSQDDVWRLLNKVMAAKTGRPETEADLISLPARTAPAETVTLTREQLEAYAGAYSYPDGRELQVTLVDDTLVLNFGFGSFDLLPLSEREFLVVDTREQVRFEVRRDGRVTLQYDTLANNPLQTAAAQGPAVAQG